MAQLDYDDKISISSDTSASTFKHELLLPVKIYYAGKSRVVLYNDAAVVGEHAAVEEATEEPCTSSKNILQYTFLRSIHNDKMVLKLLYDDHIVGRLQCQIGRSRQTFGAVRHPENKDYVFARSGWSTTGTEPVQDGHLINNKDYTHRVLEHCREIGFHLAGGIDHAKDDPSLCGRWEATHVEKQLSIWYIEQALMRLIGSADLNRIPLLQQYAAKTELIIIVLDHKPCHSVRFFTNPLSMRLIRVGHGELIDVWQCKKFINMLCAKTGIQFRLVPTEVYAPWSRPADESTLFRASSNDDGPSRRDKAPNFDHVVLSHEAEALSYGAEALSREAEAYRRAAQRKQESSPPIDYPKGSSPVLNAQEYYAARPPIRSHSQNVAHREDISRRLEIGALGRDRSMMDRVLPSIVQTSTQLRCPAAITTITSRKRTCENPPRTVSRSSPRLYIPARRSNDSRSRPKARIIDQITGEKQAVVAPEIITPALKQTRRSTIHSSLCLELSWPSMRKRADRESAARARRLRRDKQMQPVVLGETASESHFFDTQTGDSDRFTVTASSSKIQETLAGSRHADNGGEGWIQWYQ